MKKSLRLLHVISSVNPRGGGPIEGVKQRAKVLQAMGHCVEVASLDDPQAEYLSTCPLTVHALGPGRRSYGFSPRMLPWLETQSRNYDAVVVNGVWQYHSYAAWKALHGKPVPYFVFSHGMLDPYFNRAFPLKALKKRLYWPWAEYRVLRDARAVLFTSEEEKLLARQSFTPYRCNEVVVKYGTSTPPEDPDGAQRQRFLEAFPTLRGKRILLFLSRIHVKKGCDLLLEAFAQFAGGCPDLVLVMAGPDQEGLVSGLQQRAEELGLADRVVWPGMLQGDMKWGAYRSAEVFCLPSHQENFGIVVAEALACGVPALVSKRVNIWREVQGDGAGFAEEDDAPGTTELLRRWLELNAGEREAMRHAAQSCFENRFTVQGSAASLLEVIYGALR